MGMPINNPQIVAEFYAQGYRVSGTFVATPHPLPEVVHDPSTNYLLIRDAYLSPITDPAKIGAYYADTVLIKSKLDFIMTMDPKDGLRRDQRFGMGNYSFNLCLTVPFFEIRGRLQTLNRSFDPRVFMSSDAGPFITLLDVTAHCTFNPDASYQGGAALISREKISFLGEQIDDEDEDEPYEDER
jgi:hypothetical protein